jgi:hypothetical protein
MTDDQKQQGKQEKEPELKRPDEAVKDLEPDKAEGEAVKGGYYLKLDYKE